MLQKDQQERNPEGSKPSWPVAHLKHLLQWGFQPEHTFQTWKAGKAAVHFLLSVKLAQDVLAGLL